jgi:hypothetical protein
MAEISRFWRSIELFSPQQTPSADPGIVVGGGPPSALLEPAVVRVRLATYNRRLAGVLSVFTELRGSGS